MNLNEAINQDYLTAYKSKDEMKISVLRMLKSEIKNKEIELKTALSDQDIIKVIKKQVKQREESAASYEAGNRHDLAEKETNEIKAISVYLPEELSETEIEKLVLDTIAETGASDLKDIGKVISGVMQKASGQADGAKISAIAKQKLSN